jgi:hypothetical protein
MKATPSVIIPAFNVEGFISDTLTSVLSQSMPPSQVIVVDDASTDDTPKIVASFVHPRLSVVRLQENRGVSYARNCGANVASSEWLAFADGDDVWAPTHLEELMALSARFPACNVTSTGFVRGTKVPRWATRQGRFREVDYFAASALRLESIVNASNVAIRRETFADFHGFPLHLRRGEDLHLWSQLALTERFATSSAVTVLYRRRPGSATTAIGRASGSPMREAVSQRLIPFPSLEPLAKALASTEWTASAALQRFFLYRMYQYAINARRTRSGEGLTVLRDWLDVRVPGLRSLLALYEQPQSLAVYSMLAALRTRAFLLLP